MVQGASSPPPPSTALSVSGLDLSKALLDYKKGARAYFADPNDGWVMGEAIANAAVVDGGLEIRFRLGSTGEIHEYFSDLSLITSNADLPPLKNPDFMDNVDDLSLLSYLHEPAVFHGIKNRFSSEQIYTYSGMVLIAMNPFAHVNIYSTDIMREYIGSKRQELEPHIYGIAEECYQAMLQGKNQSVIVSGESGAGKTQSTKYIMQYLAVVDSLSKVDSVEVLMRPGAMNAGIKKSETEDAVLASNPILESFGNAKTTRNDNSSRFGKFVELFFSDPISGQVRITGAKIRTYLLERSRLIFQPATERNYHIFYQLCAAVPAAEKKQLGLDKWESFHYLNQGKAGVVRNVNDVEEFKATQDALSTLGMSVSMQWDIFRLCAALLHIGNISVAASGVEGSAISATDPALEKACELLGIDKAEFVKWVTKKQTVIGREKFVKDLKLDMALVSRDSVTKVIYTKLFDWLVRAINKNLKRDSTPEQQFIGVLDIYGFEHFTINSFEQFCINYANEKLQQEFNAHVFRNEQEEYVQEGIQWTMIEFSDNQQCIDLIEAKIGILGLLDEESRLQNGTDANFITKLNNNFQSHKYYSKARFGTTDFTIRHYAVDVTYKSTSFIDKNKDNMSDELQHVLAESTNLFLKEVFVGASDISSDPSDPSYLLPASKIERRKSVMTAPTLGSMFKNSLQGLMATIRETEGHYIRCVKPNMAKSAFKFEGAMVLSQLKACGVLETIKISNAGYPNKLEYDQFAARYYLLVNSSIWTTLSHKELTMKIVSAVISDSTKYQFGHTKVFLKSGQIAFFEGRRKDRLQYLVILLAKNSRRFIQRNKFLRLKDATVASQSAIRGYLARKKLEELKAEAAAIKEARNTAIRNEHAAIAIQTCWRGYQARKEYVKKHALIVTLQSTIRCIAARKLLKTLRLEAKSVEAVKEKAFSLEAKVVSLSQALTLKSLEAKEYQERCAALESHLNSWKDKFETVDTKHKTVVADVASMSKELADVKHQQDVLRAERDRFAAIVSQAVQDGLIPAVPNTPVVVVTPQRAGSIRSVSQSPNRQIERTPTKENTYPRRQFSMTRTNTVDGSNTGSSRGRLMDIFPQNSAMRTSASPIGNSPPLPPSQFHGISLNGRNNNGAPLSPPSMVRNFSSRGEDSIITALRAENEALKKLLNGKDDSSTIATATVRETGKPPVKKPTRVPTMRSKSIFEQDVFDDAELARKRELIASKEASAAAVSSSTAGTSFAPAMVSEPIDDTAPSSGESKVRPRRSSLTVNKTLMTARVAVLERPDFNEVVCDNLIVHLHVPAMDPRVGPLSSRDVFFPANVLNSLFVMQIEQGMLVELHAFVNDVVHDVYSVVLKENDKAKTAFWITNIHRLLCLVAGTYNREVRKPNNRGNMKAIMELQSLLDYLLQNELIPFFLKRLRDETAGLTVPAILENQDLPGMKCENPTTIWGVFISSSKSDVNGLVALKSYLTSVDRILCGYQIPDTLYSRVMMELLRTIGVVSFNGLLLRRNFLSFKRGCQIQYNLSQLEEWCARLGLSQALENVEMVAQAAKVLTINKTEPEDVNAVFEIAGFLNASQIEKLYAHYPPKDIDSPVKLFFGGWDCAKTDGFVFQMSYDFVEVIRSQADLSRHRDVVLLSLDPEPEYPALSVTPMEQAEKYIPASFSVPPEFAQLLA
ncbi:UNVERIFIED_CONTAM: Myosin type-2 heavy chain 1 [Siphonaria sp. JEL0065]|nr:Myosin type-2 heavy chain 1 [Siphonaria sp. JEL0065]